MTTAALSAANPPVRPGSHCFEPLEIHHFPVSGFLVPHREQGIEPPPLRRFIDVLPDGEDAMVEAIRFADDREPVLVDRAVSCPPVPVQIEHRRGRRLAALQAVERIALATDVIAVLADEDVEAPDRQVGRRIQALAPQTAQGDEGRLWRIARSNGDRAAAQICECADRVIATRDEIRPTIPVRITHRDRAAGPSRSTLRVEPRQRRIPGDIYRRVQQRRHLRFVVAVIGDIDGTGLGLEELADDLPDHRHLGVVHDGANSQRPNHQNTSIPQSARPMKS